jgi:hypothetical protein
MLPSSKYWEGEGHNFFPTDCLNLLEVRDFRWRKKRDKSIWKIGNSNRRRGRQGTYIGNKGVHGHNILHQTLNNDLLPFLVVLQRRTFRPSLHLNWRRIPTRQGYHQRRRASSRRPNRKRRRHSSKWKARRIFLPVLS